MRDDDLHASAARDAPPLLYAVVLADNSLLLVNGVTFQPLWRFRGCAIAGTSAVLPRGVARALERATAAAADTPGGSVMKRQKGHPSTASSASAAAAAAAATPTPSTFFPRAPPPSAFLAASRAMHKGLVFDPRTRAVCLNAFPGRCALQWVEPRSGGVVGELDVRGANWVSRAQGEAPSPVVVTHAAFSSDGCSLATVEVEGGGGGWGVSGL